MNNKKKTNFPENLKGFKFKIYWVYIIIFLFFIGLNFIGTEINGFRLRAFPESSNQDQKTTQ